MVGVALFYSGKNGKSKQIRIRRKGLDRDRIEGSIKKAPQFLQIG